MKKSDVNEWESVSLSSLFTFERGKEKNMAALTSGDIALISARNVNNGIKGFVENPLKVISGGNVLTLNNDGDGGAGLAYFQCIDFALDTHVTALHPKFKISPEALVYMSASISKQHSIFGHGRSISLPRAHRIQSMLPVADSGKPDYEYMSEYVQVRRKAMLTKYRVYVEARIVELGDHVEIPALSEKQWSAFRVGNLYNIKRPSARNKDDYEYGEVPFVASGAANNGVMKCCTPINAESPDIGDCITVSPVDGSTFYHPYDFLGRGGAGSSVLLLYSEKNSLYSGLFIARMIFQTCSKYTYGHMGTKDSIKREIIQLPVTDSGEPDYEYMEQYAKNTMLRKYKQYLSYLERKESLADET